MSISIIAWFFVISQLEQICKWGVKYAHLVMTDHMGSTCAHHYQHTMFHQCSPYRTLDIWFFFLLLANQNRHAKEVLNVHIWWWQTTWVVLWLLVPITTHIPSFINVAHTELWIFDFYVISQSEQICKWGINAHSVTTEQMGSICAHHYRHTKFHPCSPYRTLDIWLSLLVANQKRCANEVLNMRILWRQTAWVVLVPPLPTHQVWRKSVTAFSIESEGLPFDVDEIWPTYIHPSICTDSVTNENLSGPFSIAGGPTKIPV